MREGTESQSQRIQNCAEVQKGNGISKKSKSLRKDLIASRFEPGKPEAFWRYVLPGVRVHKPDGRL